MKLNKTIMVAALIAGTVGAAALSARAQDSTTPPAAGSSTTPGSTPPTGTAPRARMGFENIANQLSLSEDQKAKVRPILQDMLQQMAAVRKDTTLDRPSKMAKVKAIYQAATTQLQEVLTPDQLAKWQSREPGRRPLIKPNPNSPVGTNAPVATPQQ
jgi:Spy/CpxP family protein refolding chaperone